MNKIKRLLFRLGVFFIIVLLIPAYPQDLQHLNRQDVTPIMQEILSRHVDKNEMSPEILRISLKNYIDQFDPRRTYLLEHEVRPFLHPTDTELRIALTEYKQNQFNTFKKLDEIIQSSITRAKRLRKQMAANQEKLFTYELPADYYLQGKNRPFPKNKAELRKRIGEDTVDFIALQRERFGPIAVQKKQEYVLKLYDEDKSIHENSYLYVKDNGDRLTSDEKEHLFTLHILKALAKSLDSHTSFFNPSEAKQMKMRLQKSYVGTGIVFQEGLDGIIVTDIISGSPAELSGKIEKDDTLIKINGNSIENNSFSKIMDEIDGVEGTSINLTFRRPQGGIYTVHLQMGVIELADNRVDYDATPYKDGLIGRITLHSFYRNQNGVSSEKDIKAAIKDLRKQGKIKGLILDLRNNSGGYLSEAVKVAGLFITNGVIVVSEYHDGGRQYYRDVDGKTFFDGPLIVLISRSTASAAEIVAQALQDYGVAIIVGDDHSYGKGTIQSQTVTTNKGSSFFKVTVGKYYTVSGKTPQVRGVVSDIIVPGDRAFSEFGEKNLIGTSETDTIEPSYRDSLEDVRAEAKPWFMRYYLPTLQSQKSAWQKMIPELKEKSKKRLEVKDQHFSQKFRPLSPHEQMEEAKLIIQDMLELHKKMNKYQIGAYD